MKKEKLIIVVLTAVILIALGIDHYFNNAIQFSSELWKTDPGSRKEMLNNIVDGNIFLDKSRAEVIGLLGEPNEILGENASGAKGKVVLKYHLSYDKLASLKLSLNLDLENDRVVLLYKYYEKEDKTE